MADDDQAEEETSGWVGVSSREAEGAPGEPEGAYVPARHTGYVDSTVYRHKTKKITHPPLQCVNPTRPASIRGFYYCPGCGAKIKIDDSEWREERLARQLEREQAIYAGIGQAWEICWSTVVWLLQLAWWGLGRLAGSIIGLLKSKPKVTEDDGGVSPEVAPEMLAATIMMAKMMAQNRGSGVIIPPPAPESAISPAKETAEIES